MGIIHYDHQGLCPLVPFFLLYLVHYEYGIPLKMIHIDIPLSGLITSMFLAMNVSSLWQYDLEFSVPPLSFPAWAENPDPAAQHACSSTSPSLLLRVEKDRESEGRKGCCRLHIWLIKHSPNWGQSLIREGEHEKWIWRLLSFLFSSSCSSYSGSLPVRVHLTRWYSAMPTATLLPANLGIIIVIISTQDFPTEEHPTDYFICNSLRSWIIYYLEYLAVYLKICFPERGLEEVREKLHPVTSSFFSTH